MVKWEESGIARLKTCSISIRIKLCYSGTNCYK